MARILLVGNGPLPQCDPESLGFPQLRCAQFLAAIAGTHDVGLILLQGSEEPQPPGKRVCVVQPGSPDWLAKAQAFRADFDPEIVVGGGPYDAARLAAHLAGECPLWIDIPGDPFAEAQAKAVHSGEAGHTREMRGAYAAALRRADAFSVVSKAQRHALQGQLGLLGRLEGAPLRREWLHVLPVGFGFGEVKPQLPRTSAKGALVVALCGGYNTWTDGESLLKGLVLAMNDAPGLRVLSTGGAISGHHAATYETFKSGALASPFADRFTFHGWVPHSVLPSLLEGAHVGLCLDRPGVEPELGSRTRVLFYLHQGLSVVSTTRTELCRELADQSLIHSVPIQAPAAVAKILVELCSAATTGNEVAQAQGFLERRFSPTTVFSSFQAWVNEPLRVPAGSDPGAELAQELDRLRTELAAVHASPAWRVSGVAERAAKAGNKRLSEFFSPSKGDAKKGN
jgi:hypothetical protein